jgi:MFS family permease
LFAFSRFFWISVALLIPTGFALMVQLGATNTLLQSMTSDHMRGRLMSLYSMMFMGMAPFGALLAGGAADRFGAPATVAAGGLMCVASAVFYGRRLPAIREEARRLILAQQKSNQP